VITGCLCGMCVCCWKSRRAFPQSLDYLGEDQDDVSEISHLIQHGDYKTPKRVSSLSVEERDLLPSSWTSEFTTSESEGGGDGVDLEVVMGGGPRTLSTFYLVEVTSEYKDQFDWMIDRLAGTSELVMVHRIENQELWLQYYHNRASLLRKHEQLIQKPINVKTTREWMSEEFKLEEGNFSFSFSFFLIFFPFLSLSLRTSFSFPLSLKVLMKYCYYTAVPVRLPLRYAMQGLTPELKIQMVIMVQASIFVMTYNWLMKIVILIHTNYDMCFSVELFLVLLITLLTIYLTKEDHQK